MINKKRWLQNHRINNNGIIEKFCFQCEQWKEENEVNFYWVNKKYPERGFSGDCRECRKIKQREYKENNREKANQSNLNWARKNKKKLRAYWEKFYKNNKEQWQEYFKQWQKDNPDKIKFYNKQRKHKNHKITKQEWEYCKAYFNYECAYCGLPITENYHTYRGVTKLGDFHKEHVDHNGSNDLSNCVPSCQSCNSTKNLKIIDKFYESNLVENFTQERYNIIIKWIKEDYKKYTAD